MPKSSVCRCHQPKSMCDCPDNWSYCRDCQRPITWVKTENAKNMPISGHLRVAHYDHEHQAPHFGCNRPQKLKPKKEPVAPKVRQLDMFAMSALKDLNALKNKQQRKAK